MINPLLHYKSFGDINNPASIILLHGMLGSMDNWRSQAKKLSTHFHVITPDLRNHGKSPHLSGMRYQDMADDVLNLAQHLGIERFNLLGHSMGGKIAMEMALQHPEAIKHLIVVDIVPKPYQLWHLDIFKALLTLPVRELASRKQADEMLSTKIENPFERAFLLKNLKSSQTGGYEWQCNLKEISRAYLAIANFNQTQTPFNANTLFIRGEKSPYIVEETDREIINTLFTNAEIKTIDDSGHTPHIEKANDFYQAVVKFLGLPTIS